MKQGVPLEEVQEMKGMLVVVLGTLINWADVNGRLPVTITQVKNDTAVSVSKTHSTGRAFDVSVRGWTTEQMESCMKYMEKKIGHLGAYSKSDNKQRVCVLHDAGLGLHIHCQVHK